MTDMPLSYHKPAPRGHARAHMWLLRRPSRDGGELGFIGSYVCVSVCVCVCYDPVDNSSIQSLAETQRDREGIGPIQVCSGEQCAKVWPSADA